DTLCEQGDGQQSAENVRKSRCYNEQGPVDIIYGECSCFERDILLTEISQKENIIGQRMSDNSISSVIIDEVDTVEQLHRNTIDDDLIQLASDMILEQIDNRSIDVPEYDSNHCDYINMKLFIKRRISTWIKSVFHVREHITGLRNFQMRLESGG
ncbi:unnamed protein product, partial [Didymodactylos carnosus]